MLVARRCSCTSGGPAALGDDGLLFTSAEGKSLRHDSFRNRFWYPALREAGLSRVHFHDLRHTGNQLAADAGASLRELMERMGHSTAKAAMIYLHGSDERQRSIADAISKRARSDFQPEPRNRSGTQRARKRGRHTGISGRSGPNVARPAVRQ